jgi:hypothetical protein
MDHIKLALKQSKNSLKIQNPPPPIFPLKKYKNPPKKYKNLKKRGDKRILIERYFAFKPQV